MINNKFNYRINKDILLQIDKTQTNYLNFFLNEEIVSDTVHEQYLHASTLFTQNQTILENTVWNFGTTYARLTDGERWRISDSLPRS